MADACGSYLEFRKEPVTEAEAVHCMTMPGGGFHKTASGQVTDDSELATALMRGLVNSNVYRTSGQTTVYDFMKVGAEYEAWIKSDPFDCGDTTETSLGMFREPHRTAADVLMIAKSHNSASKSNGSLMKATPLAVFCAELEQKKNYKKFKEIVAADCSWIHPHEMVHDAVFLYCVAIAHLLNNPTSPTRAKDAFDLAMELS